MTSNALKIMLATDGSDDAALSARAAVDIARKTGSELHVVHAWHSVPSTRFESYIHAQLKQEAREVLAE
ncbi:MAG: universal stress protein, partial [Actinomycetota bacterium]|nr:universal stress protein [Actinomycetota bacterium]